ncbi:MAG: efflux RND transporter periplasmic adaptor subunit, partial [Bacteroidetes bacterium]|nr:efflux RND transporter periplasmic adaptor subunit [Bacteroidota bacterium]
MKLSSIVWLGVALYLGGCAAKGNSETSNVNKTVELPVMQVSQRDTTLYHTYVADIKACQNVELRARATGYLEKILVDEGQYVRKGQLMFQLNDAEFKVQVEEARSAVAMAKAEKEMADVELARVKNLVAKNIVTGSELDLAKAKLAAAEAKVDDALAKQENARIRLSYTSIRAPFDGLIDRIPSKRGSLVNEGTLLTTLSDIHQMHVYFNVSENEYLHLTKKGQGQRTGQAVGLTLPDGSVYPQTGTVETMDGEFSEGTGSIAFRASFPNPNRLLKHGASGRIRIASGPVKGLLIPQKAVFEIQDKNYVFVLNQDNSVTMRNVVPDTRVDEFLLLKSGLKDGERIV